MKRGVLQSKEQYLYFLQNSECMENVARTIQELSVHLKGRPWNVNQYMWRGDLEASISTYEGAPLKLWSVQVKRHLWNVDHAWRGTFEASISIIRQVAIEKNWHGLLTENLSIEHCSYTHRVSKSVSYLFGRTGFSLQWPHDVIRSSPEKVKKFLFQTCMIYIRIERFFQGEQKSL